MSLVGRLSSAGGVFAGLNSDGRHFGADQLDGGLGSILPAVSRLGKNPPPRFP